MSNEETKTPMPHLFKEFLQEYLEWIEEGAITGQPFSPLVGLCSNYAEWASSHNLPNDIANSIYRWMPQQHDGNEYPFEPEPDLWRRHTNPARITWVKEFLANA